MKVRGYWVADRTLPKKHLELIYRDSISEEEIDCGMFQVGIYRTPKDRWAVGIAGWWIGETEQDKKILWKRAEGRADALSIYTEYLKKFLRIKKALKEETERLKGIFRIIFYSYLNGWDDRDGERTAAEREWATSRELK